MENQKYILVRIALATLLIAGILGVHPAHAQAINFGWAQSIGGPFSDSGSAIALDSNGNVFITGSTTKSVGDEDILIRKLNANGDLVWSKGLGASAYDQGRSIAVDNSGNVVVTGIFSGTVDFDSGVGTSELTSVGFYDVFISKWNSNGDLVWAKRMGSAVPDSVYDLALDSSGNVYTTGRFFDTVDFDPGTGVYNLTVAGNEAIFISKLDATGDFVWAKSLDAPHNIFGLSMAVDADGNTYTTGCFELTVDFDPGPRVYNLTSSADYYDAFVSKLDSNGDFVWAKSMTGATSEGSCGSGNAVDLNGNVFTTGYFNGTVDFDPGVGSYNLTSLGDSDIFVSKLNNNGDFVWAKSTGGAGKDSGRGIIAETGGVYTTGSFSNTTDFDPGPGVYNLTSAGIEDIFVYKLDSNGSFVWAKSMGGTDADYGNSIALDSDANIYTTGSFKLTADFDPGAGTVNLTSAGDNDIFVSKLSAISNTPTPTVTHTTTITPTDTSTAMPSQTSSPAMITISGNTGIGPALVYYAPLGGSTSSDENGNYSLAVPMGWTGTVSVGGVPGYRFIPESRSYSNLQSNRSNQDFTPQRVYTISGNAGAAGVTLSYVDGTPKTIVSSNNGGYSFQVPEHWSGTVTPSKSSHIFTPSSRTYNDVGGDYLFQNYTSTVLVTNSNDSGSGSLRKAITDATPGATIYFAPALAGQTITLASQLDINKNLTIDGANLNPRISISGNNAVRVFSIGPSFTVSLQSLILKDGRMTGTSFIWWGGAVYTSTNTKLTITNVKFLGNSAYNAGAVFVDSTAVVTILASEFLSNSTQGSGGAVYAKNDVTIKDSLFASNLAAVGGAAAIDSTVTYLIENNTFVDNQTTSNGHGGAISIVQTPDFTGSIRKNLFSGNTAGAGGAIKLTYDSFVSTVIENNTFYANHATDIGGAIFTEGSSDIQNNTFSNNQADRLGNNAGASVFLYGAHTSLYNNVMANNTGGGECAWQGTNLYLTGAHNLVEDGSEPCANLPWTLISEPLLGPLGANGGSTDTMPLLPASPAIDTGDSASANCPATDQRGVARPQGSECDMGAFEYVPLPTATPTNTPTLTPTATSTPISNCSAVYHGPLTLNGGLSMSITNEAGISLEVQDVFVTWNHDHGHAIGADKSLRLQQASLNGVSFWNGNEYGPVLTITPSGLSIPPGESTIVFTFHQTYDNWDGSEELLISLATNGCQSYPIHANYEPPTATPTPTHTFTPTVTPPYSYNPLYLSLTGSQTIGGISFADEDILRFDGQNWSLFFDGSDVGVGSPDLFAFSIVDADTILMSFSANVTVNGIAAGPQDVLRFDATSLGSTTAGTFSMYFDGSDVGLDTTAEKIDSLTLLPDGRLLISTTGNPALPGLTGLADEDILAFTPATLGDNTSGTWSFYFDGSDVGLSTSSGEDVDALDVVGGNIYLSTLDNFSVTGLSGADEDVFVCTLLSLGSNTVCTYSSALYFDGSTWGLAGNDVDAINLLSTNPAATATPTYTPTSTGTATQTRTPTATRTPTPTATSTGVSSGTATLTPTTTSASGPTATSTPTATNTSTSVPTFTSTATLTPSATSAVSDLIFADGFESGDLSGWTSSNTDAGDLQASSEAALVGSSGLQAVIDDANVLSVVSDHPAAEPGYRARFYFDPNAISMASGDNHIILRGYSGSSTVLLRLEFGYVAAGYQIRAGLVNDGAVWTTTSWFTITDAPHLIELDWRAASASGSNNGGLTLWIDGLERQNLTGIDNDTLRIDRVLLGALSSIDAGTRGTYYFDAFESRKLSYIGP